jgi:outer membrane protein assembly factor BamE (lipoprotein component of BamABCDE complex)
MNRSLIASLLISAGVLGFCGCASDSGEKSEQPKKPEQTKDTRPMEQRLTVGMTKDDVRKALGNPSGTAVSSEGQETWTYTDHAKAFIPYYSMSGGKFHHVVVNFDKDGKVKDWSSNTTGAY